MTAWMPFPSSAIRDVGRWLAPFGLMQARRHAQQQRFDREIDAQRQQRIRQYVDGGQPGTYDYEVSIAMLVAEGLDENSVREGSIPEPSLRWVADHLRDEIAGRPPPLMVHVGNFVGVSLAYLTHVMRGMNPDALVISVDPGMPHRHIEHPDQYVRRLLATYGLSANSIVMTGYSRKANVRNDGLSANGVVGWQASLDAAPENVLPNLARLLGPRVDVVVLDGNHDPEYLKGELQLVARVLRPGGLLVLDDVSTGVWQGIADVFAGLTSTSGFDRPEHDGRVGIARRVA